ncbi:MAG: hypothetical protein KY475_08180 [Planctomycetes bacterium]|nr:hypothetical protein [Planctomycetota bacterium]
MNKTGSVDNITVEFHKAASGPNAPPSPPTSAAAYRWGGKTATNLTPRPGKDDRPDGGLSLTEIPGRGWMFPGGKVQLQSLGFETKDDPGQDDPTHFLIRPGPALIANGWTLQQWAAHRPNIDSKDRSTWPEPTAILMDNAQAFNP